MVVETFIFHSKQALSFGEHTSIQCAFSSGVGCRQLLVVLKRISKGRYRALTTPPLEGEEGNTLMLNERLTATSSNNEFFVQSICQSMNPSVCLSDIPNNVNPPKDLCVCILKVEYIKLCCFGPH